MNKTKSTRLEHTPLLYETWVPKHVGVFMCVTYVVSQNAFSGK